MNGWKRVVVGSETTIFKISKIPLPPAHAIPYLSSRQTSTRRHKHLTHTLSHLLQPPLITQMMVSSNYPNHNNGHGMQVRRLLDEETLLGSPGSQPGSPTPNNTSQQPMRALEWWKKKRRAIGELLSGWVGETYQIHLS